MGHGATVEDTRRWILVPGLAMMWSSVDLHVFANDKGRGNVLRRLGQRGIELSRPNSCVCAMACRRMARRA